MAPSTRQLLVAIAIGIAAAIGALAFAMFGEVERGGVVAGALASVGTLAVASAALYVSHQSVVRSEEQIQESRRALELSYTPVIVPIHNVGGLPAATGTLAKHPPAEERYTLSTPSRTDYAFVEESDGTCFVPIQNVGPGPALRISVRLRGPQGSVGNALNRSALVAGGVAQLSLRLSDKVRWEGGASFDRAYALEIECEDVFGRTHLTSAHFETAGTGAWVIDAERSG